MLKISEDFGVQKNILMSSILQTDFTYAIMPIGKKM